MHYRNKVATVYLLGFFIDLINMFIASVALPAIGASLQATVAQLAWISNGYIIGLTLVIPLSAWLTQRAGAKRVFLLSLLLFSVATAMAGSATSLAALLFWRVIQGAGGGLLIPVGQALAWQLFPQHQRAKLSAVVMLVGLLAPALSPTQGGWMVQTLSWRWVFFISLPVALLALALACCWLQPVAAEIPRKPLDIAGVFIGSSGLFLLLLALTQLNEAAAPWQAVACLCAALLLLTGFVRRCRTHPAPLLALPLLTDPLLCLSMLVYLCVPGIFMGVSVVSMLYLQEVLALSPASSGALMLPWSLASLLAITLTGKAFNRLGPRPLMISGCLLQAAGILLLTLLSQPGQYGLLVSAFALMGAGGSLCSSCAQTSAFLHTDNRDMPQASALWNINRQLSFCLGVALLSLLLAQLLQHVAPQQAYHWTFVTAAIATLLPIAGSIRLDNRAIRERLFTRQESQ